jgi:hypothetical protein
MLAQGGSLREEIFCDWIEKQKKLERGEKTHIFSFTAQLKAEKHS